VLLSVVPHSRLVQKEFSGRTEVAGGRLSRIGRLCDQVQTKVAVDDLVYRFRPNLQRMILGGSPISPEIYVGKQRIDTEQGPFWN
jgi:hypothetical protein